VNSFLDLLSAYFITAISLKSCGEQCSKRSLSLSGTTGTNLLEPLTPGKELKNSTSLKTSS
jgi:hypothetical protein